MINIIKRILVCTLLMTLLITCAAVSAEDPYAKTYDVSFIKPGVITVDGRLNDSEWSQAAKISLTKENTGTWTDNFTKESHYLPLDAYILWDDEGLYVAADITDNDPDTNNFNDCFEIALNPSGLIPADDIIEGLFFTFWMRKGTDEGGSIRILRHNIDKTTQSGIEINNDTLAKYKLSDKGWTLEALIPWKYISLATRPVLNVSTGEYEENVLNKFKAENKAFMTATVCYLNGNGVAQGQYECVYRTATDLKASNFHTDSFNITLTLVNRPEKSSKTMPVFIGIAAALVVSALIAFLLLRRRKTS